MARSQVPQTVQELVDPVARQRGLELVDVEFRPLGRHSVLRLYLDRPGGVGLDELADLSREVSDLLDVHDAVPGGYTLECSSPGVNRALKHPQDFARFVGKQVKVRTLTPIDGSRTFSGTLAATSAQGIEIEDQNRGRLSLPFGSIEHAHYQHDFAQDLSSGRSCR